LVPVCRVLRECEIGLRSVARMFTETIIASVIGIIVAYVLSVRYGIESALDVAVLGLIFAGGLAFNIWRWVRLVREGHRAETPWSREVEGAVDDLRKAMRVVLATP